MSETDAVEVAELSLSCEKLQNKDWLSKSDPFVVLFVRALAGADNSALSELEEYQRLNDELPHENLPDRTSNAAQSWWHYLGETEVVWNELSPSFVGKFRIPWALRGRFAVRFEIYDMDAHDAPLSKQDFLGALETPLHALAAARNSSHDLCDRRGRAKPAFGALRVCVDRYARAVAPATLTLRVVFAPHCGVPPGTRLFFVLARGAPLAMDAAHAHGKMPGWTQVHRSGALAAGRKEWAFQDASLREDAVTAGDRQRLLKLDLYLHRSNGAHLRVGATPTFSLAALRAGELAALQRVVPDPASGANLRSADYTIGSTLSVSPVLRAAPMLESFPLAALRLPSTGCLPVASGSLRGSGSSGSSIVPDPEVVLRFDHFYWWPGAKKDGLLRQLSSRGAVR